MVVVFVSFCAEENKFRAMLKYLFVVGREFIREKWKLNVTRNISKPFENDRRKTMTKVIHES